MQEDLLQFIWQYSLYRPTGLQTTSGEPVQVIHPGVRNSDAGPDFGMARVCIGSTILVGAVELHIRTADWLRHHHERDAAYKKVILHVVFQNDIADAPDNIPVLELKEHIPQEVLERYSNLIQTTAPLPCAGVLHKSSSIIRSTWLSRMLVERWQQKLGLWESELEHAGGDWQTLLWWRLSANFGFKVNSVPFLLLAQSLPLKVVTRQQSLLQTEALLFGQAGLLAGTFSDEYPQQLKEEYSYLQRKYSLSPVDASLWKFMRLRPANFPTIRLAQLAALIHQSPQIFTAISGDADVPALTTAMAVHASDYWKTHYRWGETAKRTTVKSLGTDAAHNIIINTIAPLRFLYAHQHGRSDESEQALALLEALPAEDNNIIRMWESHDWRPDHAGASQSLIQLYNDYCCSKRCLECAVGLSIIRASAGQLRPDK